MNEVVLALQAKQSITEGMYTYCRAIDRMDRDLLATVFHPDATVEFPYFHGSWSGFADWIWPSHESFDIHSHQVTNVLIDLDRDLAGADAEAYVTAALWRSDEASKHTNESAAPGHDVVVETRAGVMHEVRARYLDRWSVRDGRWAIEHRRCILDVQTISTTTGLVGAGRRDRQDPSYVASRSLQPN